MTRRGGGDGLGEAALRGALAAIAGGLVMKVVWEAGDRALPAEERFGSPTRGAVDAIARRADARLTGRTRDAASAALYTSAMATWGALYGVVQSRAHPPALAHGLLLGALVYAANFTRAAALPKAGIVPAYTDQTRRQKALPIGAHAAFGLTTAAAFAALT